VLYDEQSPLVQNIPVKDLEKICSVCGGHLISMNFHPRNWEGYYA
jgi:hypothetical protein